MLDENESLQFILSNYRSRRAWNAFVRIRLALTLEPSLQQKALDNMRAGGKHKGSATLPDVQRIDVRQQIAAIAGVGARNVSNVKTILQFAHPRIVQALMDGTLTVSADLKTEPFRPVWHEPSGSRSKVYALPRRPLTGRQRARMRVSLLPQQTITSRVSSPAVRSSRYYGPWVCF